MKKIGLYVIEKNNETVIRTDEGEFPLWTKDYEKYFAEIEVGEEIENSELLITLATRREIKKKAIRRLTAGDITKKALILKLKREKIFGTYADGEWIEELVTKLERAGYIDDSGYAKRYAEKCMTKLWGEIKIRGEMHEKGFERESVNKALESLNPDYSQMAYDYIQKNLIGEEKEVIWRRLSSRGFRGEEIENALEKQNL